MDEPQESEALIAEQVMRARRGEDALEQGWLLRELVDRFGLGQDELGRRFDKSKSWVSRRLSLVANLPTEIQDNVRQGRLAAHAAMKYFVPLACSLTGRAVSPPAGSLHRLRHSKGPPSPGEAQAHSGRRVPVSAGMAGRRRARRPAELIGGSGKQRNERRMIDVAEREVTAALDEVELVVVMAVAANQREMHEHLGRSKAHNDRKAGSLPSGSGGG